MIKEQDSVLNSSCIALIIFTFCSFIQNCAYVNIDFCSAFLPGLSGPPKDTLTNMV